MKLAPQFIVDAAGRKTGVLLTPNEFEQLLDALEDHLDGVDLDAAVRDSNGAVPYAQFREQLGFVETP